MRELYVFCEGETERGFCKQVLLPHLFPNGEGYVHTILVANSKRHRTIHRGGVSKYGPLKRDVQNQLRARARGNVYFTTLIDLYGLPSGFPGKSDHSRDPSDPTPYIVALEAAFGRDIGDDRFIPHLQLHEYETILLTDPEAFRVSFDNCDDGVESLKRLVASVTSVELINDGKKTAPSKRIVGSIPEYAGVKASAGPDIAEYIGIPTIRAKCPHFNQWLTRLESLNWGE
jgi:hypothetical protein